MFDGFVDFSFCFFVVDGEVMVQIDIIGLIFNMIYFIWVNDYFFIGILNVGDFCFCVDEYVLVINIGDEMFIFVCFGILYDLGGLDVDYGNGENVIFIIIFFILFECLEIQIQDFQFENNFDFLNIYVGLNVVGIFFGSYIGGNMDFIII